MVNSLTLEDSDNTSATYGATLAKGTDYIIAYDTGVITLATGGLFTLTTDFPATVDAVNQSGSYGYEYYTYAESWTQATLADGSAIGTQYLTLTNGFVDFILPGNAYYDITIDNGSLYCISTLEDDTHNLSPYFFLEVRQA